jgi:hypothetical protein
MGDQLLSNPSHEFSVTVLSDGTRTTAEITQAAGFQHFRVGFGEARRKKGDRRDQTLGVRLALMRAFRNAADQIEEMIPDADEG